MSLKEDVKEHLRITYQVPGIAATIHEAIDELGRHGLNGMTEGTIGNYLKALHSYKPKPRYKGGNNGMKGSSSAGTSRRTTGRRTTVYHPNDLCESPDAQ